VATLRVVTYLGDWKSNNTLFPQLCLSCFLSLESDDRVNIFFIALRIVFKKITKKSAERGHAPRTFQQLLRSAHFSTSPTLHALFANCHTPHICHRLQHHTLFTNLPLPFQLVFLFWPFSWLLFVSGLVLCL